MSDALRLLLLTLAGYPLTTLMIWLGHYWPHRPQSRLRPFHLGGHHHYYPDAVHTRSERFRYGSGRHDSLVPQMPWLIGLAALYWLLLPLSLAIPLSLEVFLLAALFGYIHSQFHLRQTWMARYHWFIRARDTHDIHHDQDMNFMVGDHFWDRIFGTYQQPATDR